MTMIRRRYPEYMSLRDAVDRMFEDAFLPTRTNGESGVSVPFDVIERQDEIVVKAPVPGFKSEDIDVTIQGDTLVVSGNWSHEAKDEEGDYHRKEWRAASFRRAMTLPDQVDSDAAEASVRDGVLELRLPKSEEVRPRQIQVKTG